MKSKKITPIMISGAYTSGKTTLVSLLEGHSKILAIPLWHDMLIDIFLSYIKNIKEIQVNSFRGNNERVINLRKMLANQDYPMLEQFALQQKIALIVSADENDFLKFNFDFYKHDKTFFESIYNLSFDDITLFNLIELFCKSFIENWKDYKNTFENTKYFISASEPGFCQYDYLFRNYRDVKVIYIKRNINEWFLTVTKRIFNIFPKYSNENVLYFMKNDPRIYNTIKMDLECYEYQQQYNNRFLVIDFNELILNHKQVIQQVVEFLNLEFEDILLKPTWLSEELDSSYNLLGKINDTKESLRVDEELQNDALKLLECLIEHVNQNKLLPKEPTMAEMAVKSKDLETRIEYISNELEQINEGILNLKNPKWFLRHLIAKFVPFTRLKRIIRGDE